VGIPDTNAKCVASSLRDCVGWYKNHIYIFTIDISNTFEDFLEIFKSLNKLKTIKFLYVYNPTVDRYRLYADISEKYGNKETETFFDNQYIYLFGDKILQLDFSYDKVKPILYFTTRSGDNNRYN
jgi:hypothetical protein